MVSYRRRAILATLGSLATLSGCSLSETERVGAPTSTTESALSPSQTPSKETPTRTPEPCTAEDIPKPTEPTAGGIGSLEYPEFPGSVTESSVASWAEDFEKVLRHNRYVAEPTVPETPSILTRTGTAAVSEIPDGYVAGVTGHLSTEAVDMEPVTATETPSPPPILDMPFGAWYRVTSRTIERTEGDSEIGSATEPPSFETAKTIHCY